MGEIAREEALTTFFVERLCQEADLVYRLGYALTLSKDAAQTLVKDTYKHLLNELPTLVDKDTNAIRMRLVSTCWQSYHASKAKTGDESSRMSKFLANMSPEARALTAVCEVGGLTPDEAAVALGLSEVTVRRSLANVRKGLLELQNM